MTADQGFAVAVADGDRGMIRLPRVVLFGTGQRHAVGFAAREFGHRALLCTDRRFASSPEMAEIQGSLADAGCVVEVFADTVPELPMRQVERAATSVGSTGIDVVIGVGGGSCLDMAKAIALLIAHGGSLNDYVGERRVPGPVAPVIAIPTTAGTGSEASPVAVLSDQRTGSKAGVSSPHLIPSVAICDSDLIAQCPPAVAASAGADALSHLVESFTAIDSAGRASLPFERVFVGKNIFTDEIALEGVRRLARSLTQFHQGVRNVEVRDDVMFGALAGGIALGTAGTAAAHALQYPIGVLTKTPHGEGVGTLLPYVMRFNLDARQSEFARLARALGLAPTGSERTDAIAAVERVDDILTAIGMSHTLAQLGVQAVDLDLIAQQSLRSVRLTSNNPRPFDLAAAQDVVRRAYVGDRSIAGS